MSSSLNLEPRLNLEPWLKLTRAKLAGTAVSNFLLGCAIVATASAGILPVVPTLLGVIMAISLYLLGMGMNDYCDRKRDTGLYPTRPLPSQQILPAEARKGLWVLFGISTAAALGIGFSVLIVELLMVALMVGYNLGFKNHDFAGPVSMGLIRFFLVLSGSLATTPSLGNSASGQITSFFVALTVGIYVSLLTWLSMLEEDGKLEERQRRAMTLVFIVFVLLCGHLILGGHLPMGVLGLVAFGYWTLQKAFGVLFQKNANPHLATLRLLLGLFLLDATIAASYGAGWLALTSALLIVLTHQLVFSPQKNIAKEPQS